MFVSSDAPVGDKTELKSDNMMLYEGDTKCLTFWYIFNAGASGKERSLETLTVYTLDTEDHLTTAWKFNKTMDYWDQGRVALTRGGDITIRFEVVHGSGQDPGYAALDEINIVTYGYGEDFSCDTLPPDPDQTTKAPCKEGVQFTCSDGTCLNKNKVCNFRADCNDHSDEKNCPDLFTFNDCNNMNDCFWRNTLDQDIKWIVGKVSDSGENGPDVNFQNSSNGKFLLVKPNKENVDFGIATALSPIYQDSSTICYFGFYVYVSELKNGYLYPVIKHILEDKETILDKLDSETIEDGMWTKVKIGIGRQKSEFELSLSLEYFGDGVNYNAGVAVDDVELFACANPPPHDSCPETEFHCTIYKGCVPMSEKCDLADNCGDYSDEEIGCENFTMINFENPDTPFGFFTQVHESSQFEWKRGNGTTLAMGTGPPFDHTHFNPSGHYLYIESSEQTANDKAFLMSPLLRTDESYSDGCRVRLFYHMHGRSVGNLTFYRE